MSAGNAVSVGIRRTAGFEPREIDDSLSLLEQSYHLRYRVYCGERKFLPREQYPTGREIDRFDEYAVHVGAVDAHGSLAGTARLVPNGVLGLPLQQHCSLYAHERGLLLSAQVLEVSRLAVGRRYCRRRDDTFHSGPERRSRAATVPVDASEGRLSDGDVFLAVLTALYRASKRLDATHWLMAIERALERVLRRHGLPFRRVGPVADYFGPVAPCVIDLAELDAVILTHRFPALDQLIADVTPSCDPDADVLLPITVAAGDSR